MLIDYSEDSGFSGGNLSVSVRCNFSRFSFWVNKKSVLRFLMLLLLVQSAFECKILVFAFCSDLVLLCKIGRSVTSEFSLFARRATLYCSASMQV